MSSAPPSFLAQALTLRAQTAHGLQNTQECATFYKEAIALTARARAEDRNDRNAARTYAESFLGLGECLQGQDATNAWQTASREAALLLQTQPDDKRAQAIRDEAEKHLEARHAPVHQVGAK